jgi:hypothetical protein
MKTVFVRLVVRYMAIDDSIDQQLPSTAKKAQGAFEARTDLPRDGRGSR